MSTDPNDFIVDAFLADSAATADGKLYVQGGGWNAINPAGLPFKQARIGIALTIGVPYSATNSIHRLEILLEGEDGPIPLGNTVNAAGESGSVMGIGSQFTVGRPPAIMPGDRQLVPRALNFDGMVFERAGAYTFTIMIDGVEANRLTFRVTVPSPSG
jgi:hypothetical protein